MFIQSDDLPPGNPYLAGLLEELAEHPFDTTLRRVIADTYEDELNDTFTADLWRYHAAVLEGTIEFKLKPEHTQRIRDMFSPPTSPRNRDTRTAVQVMQCAPLDYKRKPPEKMPQGIVVGILWLIENGMCNPD